MGPPCEVTPTCAVLARRPVDMPPPHGSGWRSICSNAVHLLLAAPSGKPEGCESGAVRAMLGLRDAATDDAADPVDPTIAARLLVDG